MNRIKLLTLILVVSVFVTFLATSSGMASSQEFSSEGGGDLTHQINNPDAPTSTTGPSGIVTLGAWRNLRPTESYLRGVSLLPDTFSVDCSSPGQASKGWIVGDAGVILSYCNGIWDHAIVVESLPTTLLDVQALEPELGVAVGDQGAVLMYLWDFIAQDWVWTKSPIPVGDKTLFSVSMTPDGSGGYVGWAVGKPDLSGKGTLLFGTATPTTVGGDPTFSYTWQNVTGNYPSMPPVDLYFSVHTLSSDNAWAVGGIDGVKGVITHWDGTSWSLFQEVGSDSLRGLHMISANDGWASGRSGEIFHFNGSSWTQVTSPTGEIIRNISFTPDGQEGWMAGSDGALLKYTAGGWLLYTDFRTDKFDFWGIDFTSGHGWVAGFHEEKNVGGHILEYEDNLWLAVTPPTDNRLNDLSNVADNDAWAVGAADEEMGGTILHWDGKHWQRWLQTDPPLPGVDLYAIDMISKTEGWAAGNPPNPAEPAVLLYWDGNRWAPPRYSAPINVRVNDIDMLNREFGWAVANNGNAVAKYDYFSGYWSANHTCGGLWYELRGVSIIPDDDYFFGWDAWAVGEMTNPSTGEYFLRFESGCGGGSSYAWDDYQWAAQCPDDDPDDDFMFRADLHGIKLHPDDAGNWGFAVGNYDDRGAIYFYDETLDYWDTIWCQADDHPNKPSRLYSVDIVEESGIAWFGGYYTPPTWNKKEAWIRYYDELGHGYGGVPYPINGLNIEHRPIASLEMSSDTMGWAVGDPESEQSVIYQYPYPNFTLEGTPETRAVMPGGTASYIISAISLGGFNANVTLDVLVTPSGASSSIIPGNINADVNAQLDIVTSGSTPLGTYWIPVEGYAVFHSGDYDIPVWRYEYVKLTVTNHPINSVNPLNGPAGTIVTITGLNFGPDPGSGNRSTASNHVILAGKQLPDDNVLSWSTTQITVQVPDNPTLFPEGPVVGEVKVMVNGEYSNADFDFQLENWIQNISAGATDTEITVTVTGTGFGNDPGSSLRSTSLEHVSLSGDWILSSNVTSWNNNTITFEVPTDTPPKLVTITSNGFESNSMMFYPPGMGSGNTIFLPILIKQILQLPEFESG